MDANLESGAALRRRLILLAYRMLGSVADAEDIVQEAFLRYERSRQTGAEVESPPAYLSSITTRLAIDQLRSARHRRESYFGPWLPEPIVTDTTEAVDEQAELADSFSLAFLVLLETLSPVERAVFLLREVFDFGYAEIAEIIDRSEANCRQLALRARRHVEDRKPRFESSRERREELARLFFAAARDGDTATLVDLLAADVVFYGDGGGKTVAVAVPMHGKANVARLLAGFAGQAERLEAKLEPVTVNGQPGAIVRDPAGRVIGVIALDIADGLVQAVRSIVNPDKLAHLGPVGDLRAGLRRDR